MDNFFAFFFLLLIMKQYCLPPSTIFPGKIKAWFTAQGVLST